MMGKCGLCNTHDSLKNSHIIPSFVGKWLKGVFSTSKPGGDLRNTANPNKRLQDIEKEYLLCGNCEGRFNKWETKFSRQIFHPVHKNDGTKLIIPYEDWALKFAVSISWRVLSDFSPKLIQENSIGNGLSNEQLQAIDNALKVWREFLLGHRPHPGPFEQHMLILDPTTNCPVPSRSQYAIPYIMRSIDKNVLRFDETVLVYSKMGRIALFGFIRVPNPNCWKSTKLHVNRGIISNNSYVIPGNILDRIISDRSEIFREAADNLSPEQRRKIL